ncbi:MAG: hypothetical protein VW455_10365 [Nitrospinota bacterium]
MYAPQVPLEKLETQQETKNPFPATPERIEAGRKIYFGKGLCVTCHSKNGSPGTGMPVWVGKVISEEEGWNAIHFIRIFRGEKANDH